MIHQAGLSMSELDLERCARLGINYLTRNPLPNKNPALDYLPFFGGKVPLGCAPRFERTPWDYGDGTGRFLEALAMAREMTGDTAGGHVDQGLMRLLFAYLNENDGLSYRPETRWSHYGADIWAQRGTLLALSLYYERTGDKEVLKRLDKLVEGLSRIAIREGEGAYLRYFWTGEGWLTDGNVGICFAALDGLVKYFEATGNESALRLAVDLVKGMVHRKPAYFNPDGSFGYPDDSPKPDCFAVPHLDGLSAVPEVAVAWEIANGHVTSRVTAAAGMIRLGVLTGNREFIERGKAVHDWIASLGSKFGWIPENVRTAGREVNEMCNLADMVGMQILLAGAGYPEYWDYVERYARNHLVESQFAITPELLNLMRHNLDKPLPDDTDEFSYRDVLERLEGGFVGPTYPNDMFSTYPKSMSNPEAEKSMDISGCCAPSGIKALYLAWSSIITRDGRGIWVNLAMNRNSEWADVASHLPYEGRVDVLVHQDAPVHIRVPGWASRGDVRLFVDGEERRCEMEGSYVVYRPGAAGRRLSARYPVRTFAEEEILAGIPYSVTWRGDTVVSVKSDVEPTLGMYGREGVGCE